MQPPPLPKDLILSTTDQVEGREIESYLGVVMGCSTRNHGVSGAFKLALQREELQNFSSLTEETHYAAQQKLIDSARQLAADAVVGITMDFEYHEAICHAACYGTAVKFSGSP